jgi:hypothetical protein
MWEEVTILVEKGLYKALQELMNQLPPDHRPSSFNEFAEKLILAGAAQLARGIEKSKLIQSPPVLVGPDGRYIPTRRGETNG